MTLIALDAGVDATDRFVSKLGPRYIAKNLETLINHGANIDIDNLVSRLGPRYRHVVTKYLDTFSVAMMKMSKI